MRMRAFFSYVKGRPLALVSLIVLFFIYTVMIFAEFIAPYDAGKTFSECTYYPPNSRIVFGKEGGLWQVQERILVNNLLCFSA